MTGHGKRNSLHCRLSVNPIQTGSGTSFPGFLSYPKSLWRVHQFLRYHGNPGSSRTSLDSTAIDTLLLGCT